MSHECNTSKSGRVDYGRWHAHDLTTDQVHGRSTS